jgi:rRNA-processing protein FCF1
LEEIGPTDAGLIYTAATEKATIITEDRRLRHWAGVREVPALTLTDLGRLASFG